MIEVYLLPILMLADGQVISGDQLEGWNRRLQPSFEICVERLEIVEQLPLPQGVKQIKWMCIASTIQGPDV